MKLVLFDVDHTLMDVSGSHRRAFITAFKKVVETDFPEWNFSGYTDLQIIHEVLEKKGIPIEDDLVSRIVKQVLDEFKKEDLSPSILLPGVEKLLQALDVHDEICVGLVTGNIEEIAYTKLKHFNIEEFFLYGGFGHASAIRSELIDIALDKAESMHGAFNKEDVWIIGDTHRDIQAAKEAGVKVIAVATGKIDKETLKKGHPDALLDDLTDTEKIIDVICNG